MKPTLTAVIVWHIVVFCHVLCQSLSRGQCILGTSLVDLSHDFDDNTIYWVTSKPLTVTVTFNGTTEGGFWRHSEEISSATHGGTHLDAPCHFAKNSWCVTDIPMERLAVTAIVVDISSDVGTNPNAKLTPAHLEAWEKQHGSIPNGSLLLVNTGWASRWPDRLAYTGTEEKNASLLSFPSLAPEAAQWLVDKRNIVGVGIDTMSLDKPSNLIPSVHIILMEKNIYGIENVNNLHLLPPTGATVFVMPMKLKGASGAPCRVFATVPTLDTSGSCGLRCPRNSIIFTAVSILGFSFWSRARYWY